MSYDQNRPRHTAMPYIGDEEEVLFDPLNLLGEMTVHKDVERSASGGVKEQRSRAVRGEERPSAGRTPAAVQGARKKNAEYANAPTREVTYETSELPSLETGSTKISEEPALLRRPSEKREGVAARPRVQRSAAPDESAQRRRPADGQQGARRMSAAPDESAQRRRTADGQQGARRMSAASDESAQRRRAADGQQGARRMSAAPDESAQRRRPADGQQGARRMSAASDESAQRRRTADGQQGARRMSAASDESAQRRRPADGQQGARRMSAASDESAQRRRPADGQQGARRMSAAPDKGTQRRQSIHTRDAVIYEEQMQAAPSKKKKNADASFGERVSAFFEAKFASFTKMDYLVCGTGVVILLAVIALGCVFFIRSRSSDGSITTMEDVGHALADLGIVGESGLVAISDARHAVQPTIIPEQGTDTETPDIPDEEEDPEAVISVRVSLTSVEKDLKIKFTNSATGKLINNAAFQVTLTPPSGSDIIYQDDDMDGIIYHNAMTPGTYGVKVEAPERYEIVECASSVNVRDTIVYEKIEVADEIKSESEVNVALEDTQMNAVIEQETVTGTLTDTVEWVESTKTTINNEAGYSEIPKTSITAPALVAGRTFYALAAPAEEIGGDASTEAPTPTEPPATTEAPSPTPTETPTPSPVPTETPTPTPTLTPMISSVTVKNAPQTGMVIGDKIDLTADVSMSQGSAADCTYEWKSSDPNIVGITGNGAGATITAKAAGSARITVTVKTAGGEKTAECTITVKAAAAKTITMDKTTLSMLLGTDQKLTATLEMTDGTKFTDKNHLTWSSSNTNVVKVDENGTVKPVGLGTATITVTSRDKDANGNLLTATCNVTVSASMTIKLDKDKTEAYTGTKFKLVATVVKNGVTTTSEKQGVVTWTSSNTAIATVDAKTGEITPIKEGTVVITATTVEKNEMGYEPSASCTVTVKKGGLSIKMDKEKAELAVGAKMTLVATVVKNGTTATSAVETWVTWSSSDPSVATVNERTGEVTGVKAGVVTITATTVDKDVNGNHLSASCVVTVGGATADTSAKLKDANGNQVFIKDASGNYVEATASDYYSADKFYIKSPTQYKYTGWQTIDNARYYFDKNGNYVTGKQIIQGVEYTFANNGVLSMGNGTFGIDVSKWNGTIDWNAVKNSGVSYVIIRCGFRGSTQGALIEDAMFRKNIEGAQAAGLKVGVYFYTQAVNEVEAVEEASMVLALVQKYRISYPIFIDTEASGGRADGLSRETRTAVCRAFCETIKNAGYTPGIYASKSWFMDKLNTSSLSSYKLWLAQYATKPTYTGRYDLWQYSDKGTINGISGKVDVNYSYLGY